MNEKKEKIKKIIVEIGKNLIYKEPLDATYFLLFASFSMILSLILTALHLINPAFFPNLSIYPAIFVYICFSYLFLKYLVWCSILLYINEQKKAERVENHMYYTTPLIFSIICSIFFSIDQIDVVFSILAIFIFFALIIYCVIFSYNEKKKQKKLDDFLFSNGDM